MSHLALRRVMVRLLHDPRFVERLYADPTGALRSVDVTPTEQRWLLATPRAAWSTDPERPERLARALADEFPVTLGVAPVDRVRFFASPMFHAAVQERRSLAAAFGRWLGDHGDRDARRFAEIESAIARVRRAPRRPPASPAGWRRLSPSGIVLSLPHGSLARYERARRDPPAAPRSTDPVATEELLVHRRGADGTVTVEELAPALSALLRAAAAPVERRALLRDLERDDCAPAEAEAVVADLERDGLLV